MNLKCGRLPKAGAFLSSHRRNQSHRERLQLRNNLVPALMDPLLTLAFNNDAEDTVAIILLAVILAIGCQSRLLWAEGR